VLTDGAIGYDGTSINKYFNIKDGYAINLAIKLGYIVGFISGRDDASNRQRAADLQISFYYGGESDKGAAFDRLLKEFQLKEENCLYIGDDIIDIPIMRRCGIAVCVADAADEVKHHVAWETTLPGGKGAVREVIVRLLKEHGRWQDILDRY
jgi:3-deoxy-D-manno-octulosonate 8-phosphate phosphatase (KDO 8-P phosphatase)